MTLVRPQTRRLNCQWVARAACPAFGAPQPTNRRSGRRQLILNQQDRVSVSSFVVSCCLCAVSCRVGQGRVCLYLTSADHSFEVGPAPTATTWLGTIYGPFFRSRAVLWPSGRASKRANPPQRAPSPLAALLIARIHEAPSTASSGLPACPSRGASPERIVQSISKRPQRGERDHVQLDKS